MDMTTLKTIIIELKDSGMTFQQVSDTLNEQYGVYRTRQAISGLYKRAKESMKEDESHQRIVCDIVNLYCILDNATQVTNELQRLGINVSYRQILNVVNKETKYIESVKQTIVANLEALICSLTDIRDALKLVEYKGVKVSKKKFDEYFELACKHYIRQEILNDLSKMYKLTSNKEMIKSIGSQFNIGVKTSDLRQ